MDILSTTSRERETYQVELQYSVLWEAALGIAAFTNTPLLDSLERPKSYWDGIRDSFDRDMRDHLDYVEKNNTWKALLQLLHQKDFAALEEFSTYIETLPVNDLRFICVPFVGETSQTLRESAAGGGIEAIRKLKERTKNNPFFPDYIEFICKCEGNELKNHLISVMTGWYEKVIQPNEDQLNKILQADAETKSKMKEKMKPEEFVEWATAGVVYAPEPSVHKVLLIPHYIYRPWNITADIENTKVFYYPISNESVSPEDKYLPSNFLVLKHKALGDEVRMRIVKLLYERSRTLQDITEQLSMGKSTIHHHLKLLRSAQLVNVEDSKYVLKKKAIDSLAKEMDLYFHQGM
ncbi:ArsR/SmtB family transcription factor [Virgibacillus natechei]